MCLPHAFVDIPIIGLFKRFEQKTVSGCLKGRVTAKRGRMGASTQPTLTILYAGIQHHSCDLILLKNGANGYIQNQHHQNILQA